jgi:serine/threonine protein kinase
VDQDDDPNSESRPTESLDGEASAGRTIGSYRILEKIGEGGMGEVWLAEQTEPVRRKVALKVIRRGMGSARVVARFEAERQALALMDHPAIAKIHDAGVTSGGRPYFVMEYVHGVPINEYCDRNALTTRERLRLFTEVCHGVQHAHQKAVIHRDLKPTNVIVARIDDRPYPKIIDFGVAKALAQPLTDRTLHTEYGVLVGTLEYMSPEQADLKSQAVDTRSDVYSLGVMLYELLVGILPFGREEFRNAGFEAMLQKIRREEPPRPSARLSTMDGKTSEESARNRGVAPTVLRRQLAGDLDWITMKALAKEPSRRYGSANDLAADIFSHLADRPVVARPPSMSYRVEKFARRHRAAVVASSSGVIALLVFAVVMVWQTVRLEFERERVRSQAETAADALYDLDSSEAHGGEVSFVFDLDRIAPLGDGPDNAAEWFAEFVRPEGARYEDWKAAIDRGANQKPGGQLLLIPDDPLLAEAQRWVEQATMRFYPDVWQPDGFRTEFPNMLMIMQLARSWIARGDANDDDSGALEDYRRVIRLGRLLRQEDAFLFCDSVGMRCISWGLEAMERRLRKVEDERQADAAALALYDLKTQQVRSAMLYDSVDVAPYASISWFRVGLDVPDWKLTQIGEMAVSHPDRRFKAEAASSLCVIHWVGRKRQRNRAREFLDEVAGTGDPVLVASASCSEDPYRAELVGVGSKD